MKHRNITSLAIAALALLPPAGRATEALLTDDSSAYTGSAVSSGTAVSLSVSSTTTKCALLRFEVTSLLPPGTTADQIATATLRLFANTYTPPAAGVAGGFTMHRVTADWREATQAGIWSAYDATPALTIGSASLGLNDFVALDMTALVKGWVLNHATNFGVILRPTGTITVLFTSKESTLESHEPILDITLAPRIKELGDLSMGQFRTGTPP